MFNGTNIKLTPWSGDYSNKVIEWYGDKDYAAFFRCLQGIAYPLQFKDLPALMGQHVLEIHADGIGFCGLATLYAHDPVSKTISTGFIVDKSEKGRGIMTDAGITIYEWIFNKMNIRRIGTEFPASNERLIKHIRRFWEMVDPTAKDKKIEECPFYEGCHKKLTYYNGEYHDVLLFGCFKNTFQKMMEKYYGRKS